MKNGSQDEPWLGMEARQDSEQLMTGPSSQALGARSDSRADPWTSPALGSLPLTVQQHQAVGGWANTQCLFHPAKTRGATQGSCYSYLVDRVTLEAGGEPSWGPRSPDSLLQSPILAARTLPLLFSPLGHYVSNAFVSEFSRSTSVHSANYCSGK